MTALLSWIIWIVVALLLAMVLVPISRLPHGAVRVFSFARQQAIVLGVAVMILAPFVLGGWALWLVLLLALVTTVVQVLYIARFFPLAQVQSLDADPALCAETDRHLSVLTSNVRLSNRAFSRLIDLVRERQPDVLILVEVDAGWMEALEPLHADYPWREARPMDTGYGLAILSRLELREVAWHERLVEGVPSLSVVIDRAGEALRLHAIHPEPPVPTHTTTGRDAEIGLVAQEVAKDALPSIVAGDLNDVAWSHTTRRFQRLSGLLDPRVGRGFYNTFHAGNPLARWPLDHLFHDQRFRLISMERLPNIGSDHFPMLFELALARAPDCGEEPDAPRREDHDEVQEMANKERAARREPIGTNWESPDGD